MYCYITDQNNVIGFTAYTSEDLSLSTGQVVKFNEVPTNMGAAFDVDTGVFTCPAAGLYFFGVTANTETAHSLVLRIVKDTGGFLGGLAASGVCIVSFDV